MAGGYSIVDVVDDTSTKVVQGVRRMSWLTIMTIGATFMISLTFILAVVALANGNALNAELLHNQGDASKQASEVQDNLQTVQLTQATLESQYGTMTSEMNSMDATQLTLKGTESSLTTSISSISSQVSQVGSSVSSLNTQVGLHTTQINSLSSKVDAAEADLSCLNNVGVLAAAADPVAFNGHYYQWVPAPYYIMVSTWSNGINFQEAEIDAASRCYNGLRGYLVTITSAEEQAFVETLIPPEGASAGFAFVGWIGAGDTASEGHWVWTNGPEKQQQFWNGGSSDTGGYAINNAYTHWYCHDESFNYCDPNNDNNQDCAHLYGDGFWNDVSCDLRTQGYFVEYGL
mmetsp:Transcript_50596/g.142316  ORF Transcript_50596/g.142316 Transcript_50596/m.142316 type:complete len:346 (+) Transcript_50596:117-1154(+)